MSRMVTLLVALALSITTPAAFGATIHIPGDSATIQAGINGAVNGDTVLVADGTYTGDGNRDIDFGGKLVVVKSENGPELCIIDCEGDSLNYHRGFNFHSGEDSTAVVEGFTIQGGYHEEGGGIRCSSGSSPTIADCMLQANSALQGAGLYVESDLRTNSETYPKLFDCVIADNIAIVSGGGITVTNVSQVNLIRCKVVGNSAGLGGGLAIAGISHGELINCVIVDNSATGSGYFGKGGAFFSGDFGGPHLDNCTIVGNSAEQSGSVIHSVFGGGSIFDNCVVAFNKGAESVTCDTGQFPGIATLVCSNLFGNEGGDWVGCIADQAGINGNFSLDPLFCDTASSDYSLFVLSPCAPANNSCGVLIGALNIGCTGPKALIDPDTMYIFQAHTIDPLMAVIYFGNFTDGHTVNDIEPAFLSINSTITPATWEILPSYPGLVGEVMEITFAIRDFILGYGSLWDTTVQVYTVSGKFTGKCCFSIDGEVTIIGHTSGDVNGDGAVNIGDLVYLIDFLFNGGTNPPIPETADLDHNGSINVADLAVLVNLLYE